MLRSSLTVLILATITGSACMLNAPVPELAGQERAATPLYGNLDIPADLDVREATVVPTVVSDAWGTNGDTHTAHTTHFFFSVHAVRRGTGEHLVLVYESNDPRPPSLLRITRLRSSPNVQLPDSLRR